MTSSQLNVIAKAVLLRAAKLGVGARVPLTDIEHVALMCFRFDSWTAPDGHSLTVGG